ncbi:hypothetical protein [Elizabethkingia meningoseptica]|uniref:hypothetical protein n=1 Tax=Elizabethkingia meningoseptica TaxID=238 RepID=UPI00162ACE17|nr:hypothetical protein [Elizabethkingia meningoseptica]MBG0514069.1 hypothetical protein [Elizabethkingia meningoseptica]MCT4181935.1 hypothetical protein [Elizabethkingia anophelis]MDE5432983.1 hypothetical protein [Elizabethkingia meningoseptica]
MNYKKVFSNIERPKITKEYNTNIGVVKFDSTTNSFYSKNNENVDFAVTYWFKEVDEAKEIIMNEQHRIWSELYGILPIDDNGDLIQGDEVHHIVFNNHIDENTKNIFKKSFEASVEIVMRYLSENHHPHTMIQIESNSAQLFEGVKSHLTDKHLKD